MLLRYLMTDASFAVHEESSFRDHLAIAGIAVLFGFEVIVADVWFAEYPADINIPFPRSLLFYPTIGFIVEISFHLLPLAAGIFALSRFTKLPKRKVVWVSIFATSALEPLYQMWFSNHDSLITLIYTGIHVFLFSLVQLLVFKRFGFISMYGFRLVFYAIWHVAWGTLRLDLLF